VALYPSVAALACSYLDCRNLLHGTVIHCGTTPRHKGPPPRGRYPLTAPPTERSSMHTAEELLKRAAECERLATAARDTGSKATWKGMADRWRQCAETAANDSVAAVHHASQPTQHRQPTPAWAAHHH
jgi:hypothetical protein